MKRGRQSPDTTDSKGRTSLLATSESPDVCLLGSGAVAARGERAPIWLWQTTLACIPLRAPI